MVAQRSLRAIVEACARRLGTLLAFYPDNLLLPFLWRIFAVMTDQHVIGVISNIDLIAREVAVVLPGGPIAFDVPPDCAVVLHGERVKLRLIQPGDQATVSFVPSRGSLVARRVEVPPRAASIASRV